jgi:hypothetical protein
MTARSAIYWRGRAESHRTPYGRQGEAAWMLQQRCGRRTGGREGVPKRWRIIS